MAACSTAARHQCPNCPTEWRTDGKLHHGTKYWYIDGSKWHRTDGPAIERGDGYKAWYVDGKRHRADGPAIDWGSGDKRNEWFLDGLRMFEPDFELFKKTHSVMHVQSNGDREWRKDGKLHRTDGPAIEWANGTKKWYADDQLHRTDGPAIEYADGTKWWWVDGERHRTDGPAFEAANGDKTWWIHGQRHRTDGPACEWADGGKEWYIHGKPYANEQEFEKSVRDAHASKDESTGTTTRDTTPEPDAIVPQRNETLLLLALRSQQSLDVVEALLHAVGADPNERCAVHDATPLEYVIKHEHPYKYDVVRLLVQNGAVTHSPDGAGIAPTPMQWAVLHGDASLIRVLASAQEK